MLDDEIKTRVECKQTLSRCKKSRMKKLDGYLVVGRIV